MLWTLRELEQPYKIIRLDPFKGDTNTPDFRRLNPSGKIPVLLHGEEVLTESLAIMEYLNDISENRALTPTDPKEAYNYRKIIHYGLTEIEPYLWLAEQAGWLKAFYTWPEGTYEQAINMVKTNIGPIEQWTENREFIACSKFSLADIYYYHLITWAQRHNVTYTSGTANYLKQLERRAAFPAEMQPS